MSIYIEAVYFL